MIKNLDDPIAFARHLRRSETSGEYLMWQILRNRQRCGTKFRRQHPYGPYVLDFFSSDARLVIECDGKHHFTDEGKERDRIRDAWLERPGLSILRFTNQQIENDTQTVMQAIDAWLVEHACPSPPAPLPEDGERGANAGDMDSRRERLEIDDVEKDGFRSPNGRDLGMTLIELLVVLVIVTSLAAATLPAFKSVLIERKTSVASLEVRAFLESARTRAISRGRPVSVILERLSSRTDGVAVNTTMAISATNPPRSIIAENPPHPFPAAWAPGDMNTNFDSYNSCVRMVMAETLRPTEFEIFPTFLVEGDTSIPAPIRPLLDDNDLLVEPGRILSIPNTDARLAGNLIVGNEIEIIGSNDQAYSLLITKVIPPSVVGAALFLVNVRNEGNLANNSFGSNNDVNQMAADQTMVHPFVFISGISGFRIYSRPRPVASLSLELPKGTCIDLSLSGLAYDDPLVNPPAGVAPFSIRRDCRHEFSSDWIGATIAGVAAIPMPHQLRPVYLTFSPNGSLSHVYTNTPDGLALRRIDPPSDVCLFVGRNDQVLQALTKDDLLIAEDNSINPNLLDSTGFWIRVSPSSGAISTAPALVSAIRAAGVPATTPVGALLSLSRQGLFNGAQSSQ